MDYEDIYISVDDFVTGDGIALSTCNKLVSINLVALNCNKIDRNTIYLPVIEISAMKYLIETKNKLSLQFLKRKGKFQASSIVFMLKGILIR